MASKKKTSENSTTTVTPNNPEWMTRAIQGQTSYLDELRGKDPLSFVAPASALQNQAFGVAQGLGGRAAGQLDQAATLMQGAGAYTPQNVAAQQVDPAQAFASLGAANPTSALSGLLSGAPNNPYLASMNQANINQAMQGYNDALTSATNTLTRSVLPGIRSGGILAGQYGGSRQGIAEGVAMGDVGTQLAQNARNLAQSAMDSGNKLYGGAYESAQDRMSTTANNLAGLSLQAAQQNAANSLAAQQSNQSAGLQGANLNLNAGQQLAGLGQYELNTLGELGATQQQLAQQQAQAPLATAQAISGMYGQLPLNLFNGSTTNRTGTTKESGFSIGLDDIGRLATFATSDPRAKRDIAWTGRDPVGRNVYDYNLWTDPEGTPPRRGLMADETLKTDPDAVGIRPDGLAAINYDHINNKTAAAVGEGLGSVAAGFDPEQRPGAIGLPTPEEAAVAPRRPKPFSDPSVLMSGWRPEWSGAGRPMPFSDPSVLMDGWAPGSGAGGRPKPFSDPSVLMKSWRPRQPKLSALDAIDDPRQMVDALQPLQLSQPRPFAPARPAELGSMLLDMLRQNRGGLIGGSFPRSRA